MSGCSGTTTPTICRSLLERERKQFRHALTEGVFSMDGDLAPLPEIAGLAKEHDAWLLTDDAHGIGVVGGGRGSAYVSDPPAEVPLQMGTLSKAIGSYGGYLCASREVIELMQNRARTLIYSNQFAAGRGRRGHCRTWRDRERAGIPRRLPLRKARAFTRAVNLPLAESPVVPVTIGAAGDAIAASKLLEDEAISWSRSARRPCRMEPRTACDVQCGTAGRKRSRGSPTSSATAS